MSRKQRRWSLPGNREADLRLCFRICKKSVFSRHVHLIPRIGRFQAIKTDVLLIFSFITGDKIEFLSPMMFSNEYITGI